MQPKAPTRGSECCIPETGGRRFFSRAVLPRVLENVGASILGTVAKDEGAAWLVPSCVVHKIYAHGYTRMVLGAPVGDRDYSEFGLRWFRFR